MIYKDSGREILKLIELSGTLQRSRFIPKYQNKGSDVFKMTRLVS